MKSYIHMEEQRLPKPRRKHTRGFKLECCRQAASSQKRPPRSAGSTTSQRERTPEVETRVRRSRDRHPPYAFDPPDGAFEPPSGSEGLIHQSDQGVQYASSEYVLRLEEVSVRINMASVGNPYEKSKAESFFRTLKMEEVYLNDYQDFEEAYENIARFIEEVCNHKRLHSSLGYLSPVEFEDHYLKLRS
jgi:transposase InsO family protein